MTGPRLGIALYATQPPATTIQIAETVEDLGYDAVWIPDSPVIWREVYVNLAAIAVRTQRVLLGPAVTNGVTRHPTVTASAAATLRELSGARFRLGLGNGDSALATSGAGRAQTLAEFRDTVQQLAALANGQSFELGPRTVQLAWSRGSHVPLYVAASGPKMLELAGEIADGVIMMVGLDEATVRASIDRIHAGARRANRDPSSLQLVLWTACCASDIAPDAARDAVKAYVARAVIRKLPVTLPAQYDEAIERIRGAYDYTVHSNPGASHAQYVPDSLVPAFAVAGTTAECVEQIRTIVKLAVDEVVLALPDVPFDDRPAILTRLAKGVLA